MNKKHKFIKDILHLFTLFEHLGGIETTFEGKILHFLSCLFDTILSAESIDLLVQE